MSKDREPATTAATTPSATAPDASNNRGILFGLSAYGIWGLVPLFWNLVKSASALEILAMRMVWSLVFAIILAVIMLPRGWLRAIATRRNLFMLAAAAVLISVNWGVYIWATTNGHVTEAALGYYINPIFSIVVGVVFLKESLRRYQWVAVAIAVLAVVVLTVAYGKPPWVALTLAFSFGTYGLLKNLVRKGAVETLVIESAFIFIPAVAYVLHLQAAGRLTFGHLGWVHSTLLAAAGLVTLIPLLLFAAAATRLPLSMIGLLQYITPTTQFLLGVLYFGEQMPAGRWIGFGLVWIALIILSTGMVITVRRRGRRPIPAE